MTYNSDRPATITVAAEMTGTVSAALLSPVIARLKAWQAPPLGMEDWIAPLEQEPHERELIRLSRKVAGLRDDDEAVTAAWSALVETYITNFDDA